MRFKLSIAGFLSTPKRRILWSCLLTLGACAFVWLQAKTTMCVAPWLDEVAQVDAGVNLYLGNGWTNTAWSSLSERTFWAGNNPLYPFLVYLWVSALGFSAVTVRCLNFLLALAITYLVVDATRRANLLHSPWSRMLLASLLLCNATMTFVYRSGRADLVSLLVVTILFRLYLFVQQPARRWWLLCLCGMLLLPSGLQTIPYAALLLCLDYYVRRRLRIQDIAAVGLGTALGGLVLAAIFLSRHALYDYCAQTFASGYNIFGCLLQVIVIRDQKSIDRLTPVLLNLMPWNVLATIVKDHSLAPLVALFPFLAIWPRPNGASRLRAIARAGLVATLLVPLGMLAAGRYPFYYAWMGAVPATIVFVIALEASWAERKIHFWLVGSLAAVVSLCLGMPSIVWRQVIEADPGTYRAVEAMVRQETKKANTLFGSPPVYYAAKQAKVHFLCTSYSGGRGYPRMTDDERGQISVLILVPEEVQEAFDKVGGSWTQTGSYHTAYGQFLVFGRNSKAVVSGEAPGT
jgi:hypothetical protein